jgi:hypothetical protein
MYPEFLDGAQRGSSLVTITKNCNAFLINTVVFKELIIVMTYLLACNLVVQHIISCNWVLPVGNIFIIIIIIIIIIINSYVKYLGII